MFAGAGRTAKALYIAASFPISYGATFGMRVLQETAQTLSPNLPDIALKDWQVWFMTGCGPFTANLLDLFFRVIPTQDRRLTEVHNELKDRKIRSTSNARIQEALAREKITEDPTANRNRIWRNWTVVGTAVSGAWYFIYPPASIPYALASTILSGAGIGLFVAPGRYLSDFQHRVAAHDIEEMNFNMTGYLGVTLEPTPPSNSSARAPLLASEHESAASETRIVIVPQAQLFGNRQAAMSTEAPEAAQTNRRSWWPFGRSS